MPDFPEQKEQIIEFGRRLYNRNMIAGCDGNLSIRLDNGNVLITATSVPKGFLTREMIVEIDMDGKIVGGSAKPSSEYRMHLFVYRNRPEINACCHAHPVFTTAYAVSGRQIPHDVLPETVLTVGKIAHTRYAPPGTEAVGKSLKESIRHHNAFVLANHGVLTIGDNLLTAYNRMETVEHLAKIIYIAERMGTVRKLDENELKRLENL